MSKKLLVEKLEMRKKEEAGNRSLYWQPMVSLWPAYGQLMEHFLTILEPTPPESFSSSAASVRVMFHTVCIWHSLIPDVKLGEFN